MMRITKILAAVSLPCLLLAGSVLPVQASAMPCRETGDLPAPGPAPADVPEHHFKRVGQGLACVLSPQDGAAMGKGERPVSYLPCLTLGAVAITDTQVKVEKLLGEPTQSRILDDHTEARVYPVRQRSIPEPYYVVTYRDQIAVAVQLIGPPTELPASLSSVSLGDDAKKVIDTFGRPARRCVIRPGVPETWMWPPFPIGVDMRDGRVVGLKVTWPTGHEK